MVRFIRSYFFENTGSPGSRLRKGDKPTQSTFQKLLASCGFIKEAEDTATTATQGFTKLASDLNSYNLDSTVDADSFAKAVRPHQISSVSQDTGILVTKTNSATGRTGGTGANYAIKNLMEVAEAAPGIQPVVVSQVGPGENVLVAWDPLLNAENGYVKVSDDLGSGVNRLHPLEECLDSDDESILIERVDTPVGPFYDAKMNFTVKKIGKPNEITMFWGTTAQIAAQFFGGYCTTVGDKWRGWAICDGGTYNSKITPDMRGAFPVGVSTLYPNCGTTNANKDSSNLQGVVDVTLTADQSGLRSHVHAVTDPGHSHSYANFPNQALSSVDAGSSASLNNLSTAQTSGSSVTGITIGAVSDLDALDQHENRPPFMTVQFVIYVGY